MPFRSAILVLFALTPAAMLCGQDSPVANPAPSPATSEHSGVRGPAAAFTPPKKRSDRNGYRALAENSPFTNRPAVEVATEETPFPELSLIGYMVLGGKMNAWVQTAEEEDPVQLVEGVRDEASGYLLVGIKGAEDMFTAQAEIEANGKRGTLRFTDGGIAVAPGEGAPKQGGAQKTPGAQGGPGGPGGPGAQPATPGVQPAHPGFKPPVGGKPRPTAKPGSGNSGGSRGSEQSPAPSPRRRILLPR